MDRNELIQRTFPYLLKRLEDAGINATPEVAHSMDASVHDPVLAPMAASAIDTAYTWTLSIAIAVALSAAIATAVLLKDNPKETKYAHE